MATGECPTIGESSGIIGGLDHFVQPADRKIALGRQCGDDRAMTQLGVPSTVRGSFAGTAQVFQETMNSQVILIIAAIATVYIVLGILYESYVHPLTILSTLPSAGVGALLALELFNAPFSLIALIGIMLLIGIVKKNAIMMVDFALEAQRHGNLTPQEAIFRPVCCVFARL